MPATFHYGCIVVLLALSGACKPLPPPEVPGHDLVGYVDAQLAFGPRYPGSAGHDRMKSWLDSMTRARADSVVVDDWTTVTSRGDTLRLRNVLAQFAPENKSRILYLAHWDTRPRADGPGSTDSTAPVMGANDGASGVALLLGVADALHRAKPSIGVDLLLVDGEDFGSFQDSTQSLLGSRRYSRQVTVENRPRFAVLWDMVGDKDLRLRPEGSSLLAAPDLVARLWQLAQRLGYGDHFDLTPGTAIIDDHIPLQNAGIRAIDLIDLDYGPQNRWHHSTEDTRDKISPASLALMTHLATAIIRQESP